MPAPTTSIWRRKAATKQDYRTRWLGFAVATDTATRGCPDGGKIRSYDEAAQRDLVTARLRRDEPAAAGDIEPDDFERHDHADSSSHPVPPVGLCQN
jgi:hypothetical protein